MTNTDNSAIEAWDAAVEQAFDTWRCCHECGPEAYRPPPPDKTTGGLTTEQRAVNRIAERLLADAANLTREAAETLAVAGAADAASRRLARREKDR